jgi:hypothetical protein
MRKRKHSAMNSDVLSVLAWGTFAVSSFLATSTARAENVLVDGSFAEQKRGIPANWSVRDNKQEVSADATEAHHPDVNQTLRVDILCDGGSSYGQIAQAVSVKPNTVYRFTGDWRSSKGQTTFFRIKRIKDRKELDRVHLGWSSPAWQRVTRHVNSGEADMIEVVCRYRQKRDFVGLVCWYTNLSLSRTGDSAQSKDSVATISEPMAQPTFKTPTFVFPDKNPDLRVAAPGVDQYVTVTGAGKKTGTAASIAISSFLRWTAVAAKRNLRRGLSSIESISLSSNRSQHRSGASRGILWVVRVLLPAVAALRVGVVEAVPDRHLNDDSPQLCRLQHSSEARFCVGEPTSLR